MFYENFFGYKLSSVGITPYSHGNDNKNPTVFGSNMKGTLYYTGTFIPSII